MKFHLWATLAAGLVLSTGGLQEQAQKDLQAMQGTWQVVSMKMDGKDAPAEYIKGATLEVKEARFVMRGGGDDFRGKMKLDPTKKPRAVDATFVDAVDKEKGQAHGIYELQGDRLTFCWAQGGQDRPRTFASEPGSKHRLIVLQRAK